MDERILDSKPICIVRSEAGFDRACEDAYRMAVALLGIDGGGHSARIKGWDRSCCFVRMKFKRYRQSGSMAGISHLYTFRAEAVQEKRHA